MRKIPLTKGYTAINEYEAFCAYKKAVTEIGEFIIDEFD
jgi:hypothetical protein